MNLMRDFERRYIQKRCWTARQNVKSLRSGYSQRRFVRMVGQIQERPKLGPMYHVVNTEYALLRNCT
jgi:hypothetical protein